MSAPVELDALRDRQLRLLAGGEYRQALQEAAVALEQGVSLEDFVLGVLAPVQLQVGLRWQAGSISTEQERRATEVADILLTMASARRGSVSGGANLVMCVADREHHNLPARMVAELLRDEGHHVTFLGAARPKQPLTDLLLRLNPDALVVSCSLAMNLPGVLAITDVAHQAGVPVIAGGQGFGGLAARADRVAADGHAVRVAEVVDRVRAAADGGLRARPDDDRALQHVDLVAARAPLCAEITDRLLWRATPLLPRALRTARPLRAHVENLMRFVEAATLVDDEVLVDYTGWLTRRWGSLRADPAAVPTLLAVTRDRLAPDAPVAAAAVHRSLTSTAA